MLTCKETSYLASKKLDKRLALSESMGFWLHVGICSLCRGYAREIKKLHGFIQKAGKSGLSWLPESVKLSEQSRERIRQALDIAIEHKKK